MRKLYGLLLCLSIVSVVVADSARPGGGLQKLWTPDEVPNAAVPANQVNNQDVDIDKLGFTPVEETDVFPMNKQCPLSQPTVGANNASAEKNVGANNATPEKKPASTSGADEQINANDDCGGGGGLGQLFKSGKVDKNEKGEDSGGEGIVGFISFASIGGFLKSGTQMVLSSTQEVLSKVGNGLSQASVKAKNTLDNFIKRVIEASVKFNDEGHANILFLMAVVYAVVCSLPTLLYGGEDDATLLEWELDDVTWRLLVQGTLRWILRIHKHNDKLQVRDELNVELSMYDQELLRDTSSNHLKVSHQILTHSDLGINFSAISTLMCLPSFITGIVCVFHTFKTIAGICCVLLKGFCGPFVAILDWWLTLVPGGGVVKVCFACVKALGSCIRKNDMSVDSLDENLHDAHVFMKKIKGNKIHIWIQKNSMMCTSLLFCIEWIYFALCMVAFLPMVSENSPYTKFRIQNTEDQLPWLEFVFDVWVCFCVGQLLYKKNIAQTGVDVVDILYVAIAVVGVFVYIPCQYMHRDKLLRLFGRTLNVHRTATDFKSGASENMYPTFEMMFLSLHNETWLAWLGGLLSTGVYDILQWCLAIHALDEYMFIVSVCAVSIDFLMDFQKLEAIGKTEIWKVLKHCIMPVQHTAAFRKIKSLLLSSFIVGYILVLYKFMTITDEKTQISLHEYEWCQLCFVRYLNMCYIAVHFMYLMLPYNSLRKSWPYTQVNLCSMIDIQTQETKVNMCFRESKFVFCALDPNMCKQLCLWFWPHRYNHKSKKDENFLKCAWKTGTSLGYYFAFSFWGVMFLECVLAYCLQADLKWLNRHKVSDIPDRSQKFLLLFPTWSSKFITKWGSNLLLNYCNYTQIFLIVCARQMYHEKMRIHGPHIGGFAVKQGKVIQQQVESKSTLGLFLQLVIPTNIGECTGLKNNQLAIATGYHRVRLLDPREKIHKYPKHYYESVDPVSEKVTGRSLQETISLASYGLKFRT